jgi:hypothetical protein
LLTISIRTSWDGVRGIARLVMAFAALLLVSSFVAPRAFAQTTGSLEGVVLDTDGLEVPSATVTLTGTNLIGGKQEQATDGAGYFRFSSLLPGLYDITVSKAGFTTTSVKGIQVLINRTIKQDVTLPIGEAAEVIDIVAQQAIDRSSTTVGQVLTKDFLQKIPTGQSYQQAVQLAAGVTGGGNPNMAGGGSNENQYLLDGATVTDPVTGTFSPQLQLRRHPADRRHARRLRPRVQHARRHHQPGHRLGHEQPAVRTRRSTTATATGRRRWTPATRPTATSSARRASTRRCRPFRSAPACRVRSCATRRGSSSATSTTAR